MKNLRSIVIIVLIISMVVVTIVTLTLGILKATSDGNRIIFGEKDSITFNLDGSSDEKFFDDIIIAPGEETDAVEIIIESNKSINVGVSIQNLVYTKLNENGDAYEPYEAFDNKYPIQVGEYTIDGWYFCFNSYASLDDVGDPDAPTIGNNNVREFASASDYIFTSDGAGNRHTFYLSFTLNDDGNGNEAIKNVAVSFSIVVQEI